MKKALAIFAFAFVIRPLVKEVFGPGGGKVQEIKVTANGLELKIPYGTTVDKLLDILKEPVRHDLIVEVNRKFIHVKEYGTTAINEGDNIEVIGLDFGG